MSYFILFYSALLSLVYFQLSRPGIFSNDGQQTQSIQFISLNIPYLFIYASSAAAAYRFHEEEPPLGACGGGGADRSLVGAETVPQLAGERQKRWLRRGFSGHRLKTERRLSCWTTTKSIQAGRPAPRSFPPALGRHGVADAADPEAGGLGFGHGRMVLRPRPEHIRQRSTSLHLALSAMFPLHAVHGEFFPSLNGHFSNKPPTSLSLKWFFFLPPRRSNGESDYYLETMLALFKITDSFHYFQIIQRKHLI